MSTASHNYVVCRHVPFGAYDRETVKIRTKGEYNLIAITKEEANLIRKKFPNEHIAITGRNKKSDRKKYYVSESRWVKNYLNRLRKGCVI